MTRLELISPVAPFVGHNAFLRWSALQEAAFVDAYDGEKRVWSEEHVSEDFQIALTLQSKVSHKPTPALTLGLDHSMGDILQLAVPGRRQSDLYRRAIAMAKVCVGLLVSVKTGCIP